MSLRVNTFIRNLQLQRTINRHNYSTEVTYSTKYIECTFKSALFYNFNISTFINLNLKQTYHIMTFVDNCYFIYNF